MFLPNMLRTFTGRLIDPFELSPSDVDVRDIAHALSMLCRFNGHCFRFYSVAEHSILVATSCSPAERLQGLLHDAAEAYLGDVPSPLKHRMPEFCRAEERVWSAVARHFGFSNVLPAGVAAIDKQMLEVELAQLMDVNRPVLAGGTPVVRGLTPEAASREFLRTYQDLRSQTCGGKAT